MIDMDDVIVSGRFREFLNDFLGKSAYDEHEGYFRQDALADRTEEFKTTYANKNIYQNDDGSYVLPMPDCVEVIKRLNEEYNVYVVTAYVWKKDVINASCNLKNKHIYLTHFFPFIDETHFIYINEKKLLHFDIGIDDRMINLTNCDKKILFNEPRNQDIPSSELQEKGIIRVYNWKEIDELL